MHHSIHSMLLRVALTASTLLVLWAFGEPVSSAAQTVQSTLRACPVSEQQTAEVAERDAAVVPGSERRARQRRLILTLPFAVNLSPVNAGDAERI